MVMGKLDVYMQKNYAEPYTTQNNQFDMYLGIFRCHETSSYRKTNREYIQNVMLKYRHRTDAFKTLVLKSKLFFLWLIKLNVPFWRRKWQPTPVLLLGEPHGQRSLVGYSPWGCKESDMTKRLSTAQHTIQRKSSCHSFRANFLIFPEVDSII